MPKTIDEMTSEEFHEFLKPYQPELLALARASLAEQNAEAPRAKAESKPEKTHVAGT